MASKPTKAQARVLEAIREYIAQHGYSPSIRDLMVACDLYSPSTVYVHMNNLKAKGLISFKKGIARSIRVIDESEKA